MVDYFEPNQKGYLGRPRVTLPRRLHMDLQPLNEAFSDLGMNKLQLQNIVDLNLFRSVAQERVSWMSFVKTLILYNG